MADMYFTVEIFQILPRAGAMEVSHQLLATRAKKFCDSFFIHLQATEGQAA